MSPGEVRAEGELGPSISLRAIGEADLAFLSQVYAETRREELVPVPWTEEEKTAFLQAQFEAQHAHYQNYYSKATFSVVEYGGIAAGRLYVNRGQDELRLVDIAVLPQFRALGIGSALLEWLIAETDVTSIPITIHVERNNPALRWYERYGFEVAEDKGVYLFMRRG